MMQQLTKFKMSTLLFHQFYAAILAFLGIVTAFCLMGCHQPQAPISLEQALIKLQKGKKEGIPEDLIKQAQSLIEQSQKFGFKLIDSQTLAELSQKEQIRMIDTSAQGKYLLEHLDGALYFDASTLPTSGDMEESIKKEFLHKIGTNPLTAIVFYHQDSPLSSANTASIWAKKLGYHNVYLLIGNLKECKLKGLHTTHEVPKCCQNPQKEKK